MVVRMVLAVQKHLQITNMITLDNFDFKNFLKKSIPWDVRAQVLQEPVGGSHADQGRKSCVPRTFLDPGGQARSNGTPHLPLASRGRIPQGGGVVVVSISIYNIIFMSGKNGHETIF